MYKQESKPKTGIKDNFFGMLMKVRKIANAQKISDGILVPKSVILLKFRKL
jgi:hypothetical protein